MHKGDYTLHLVKNAIFTVTRYWQALLIRLLACGQQRLVNAITPCGATLQRWSQSSSTLTAFWWAPAPWIQLPDSTILLQVNLIWFFPLFNVFHFRMWYDCDKTASSHHYQSVNVLHKLHISVLHRSSYLTLPFPLAWPVLSCWAPTATIMKIEVFQDVTFYHWENSSQCFRELYSLLLQGQGSKKWWRWRHYNPLQCCELLSWQHSITSLMASIFSNTMVRISDLPCYQSILITWLNDYRFFS